MRTVDPQLPALRDAPARNDLYNAPGTHSGTDPRNRSKNLNIPSLFPHAGHAMIHELLMILLAFALVSIGGALFGLYAQPREFWRGFWFMTGLWGWIDAGIVQFGLLTAPPDLATLRTILFINTGLDVVYMLIGAFLLTRPRDLYRGFGWAIISQGLGLFVLDGAFTYRLST
ncbi:MAG: DUF6992 family protein [Gemmataceae bacterium]